jgi:hypothetical protein
MEPQQRRPRPDLGCSAIGWMEYTELYRESMSVSGIFCYSSYYELAIISVFGI